MIDYTKLAGGCDFSHWNGVIDWPKVVEVDRPSFVVLKSTQGMAVDGQFEANRKGAADAGIPWLWYPFLQPSDDARVIANALRVIGDPTIPAGLDWEESEVPSHVVEQWIDTCPRQGLAYYGLYPPAPATPRIGSWPRWFPQYPGDPTRPPRLPMWDGSAPPPGGAFDWRNYWLVWQWSETARIAGVGTQVDLDRLAVPADDFLSWYRSGVLPTRPPTAVDLSGINRVLRLYSEGSDVAVLQHWLAGRGYPIAFTAVYDSATVAAVKQFQQARQQLTVDGIFGPESLEAAEGL